MTIPKKRPLKSKKARKNHDVIPWPIQLPEEMEKKQKKMMSHSTMGLLISKEDFSRIKYASTQFKTDAQINSSFWHYIRLKVWVLISTAS